MQRALLTYTRLGSIKRGGEEERDVEHVLAQALRYLLI